MGLIDGGVDPLPVGVSESLEFFDDLSGRFVDCCESAEVPDLVMAVDVEVDVRKYLGGEKLGADPGRTGLGGVIPVGRTAVPDRVGRDVPVEECLLLVLIVEGPAARRRIGPK